MLQSAKSKGPSGVGVGRENARPRGRRPSARPGPTTTGPGGGDCPLICPPQPLPALSPPGFLSCDQRLACRPLTSRTFSLLSRGSVLHEGRAAVGPASAENRSHAVVTGAGHGASATGSWPAHRARTSRWGPVGSPPAPHPRENPGGPMAGNKPRFRRGG